MVKIVPCTRDHSKSFLTKYAEVNPKGGLKIVKRCAFIIGTANNNSAVLCGEFPDDKDLPISFMAISNTVRI